MAKKRLAGTRLGDYDYKLIMSSRINRPLVFLVLILTVVGCVMMYSASYANGIYYHGSGEYYIKRQAAVAVVGIILMIIISYFPYMWLHKCAYLAFGFSYLLLALTLTQKPINSAKRWIIIGSHTFQPSEIIKFAIILLFAHLLSINYKKMESYKTGAMPYFIILFAVCIITILQPHISCTILIFLLGCAMMFIGGTKVEHFLFTGAAVVPVAILFLATNDKYSYIFTRVGNIGGGDTSGGAYQTYQSKIAIGSGGLFGLGLGCSRQKQMYVPEAQNDFIFSIVCEEMGFVGAVLIILMFIVLIVMGVNVAQRSKDRFGAYLAGGVMAELAFQILLNLAVVVGWVNTGVALPFFSKGGTALLMVLAEMGVVLSVDRYSKIENNGLKK